MGLENWLSLAAVTAAGYLLGSVNFGIILSRALLGEDVRQKGSGNAGFTNMLRAYGKLFGALTLAGDVLKAYVSAALGDLLPLWLGLPALAHGPYYAALAAFLGHLFPIYFGFKGGKGVSVAMGSIVYTAPPVIAALVAIWAPLIFVTGIVSIATLGGGVCYPLFLWLWQSWRGQVQPAEIALAGVIGALIVWAHRANIRRLLNGTENSFKKKKG